ncbi:hypothetical protein TNCV_4982921 [Trichonephila clavipes]|uniref:Uncharacterized protein n=1 Tax=Trichonephila clavipes TaxID=2585209 RepID=A0A8X6WFT1_TRICX|nr:hypothetical protein TNCV_4982921 [Trichonephila clavipes]
MSSLDQRANIKFCVFLQKSPSEYTRDAEESIWKRFQHQRNFYLFPWLKMKLKGQRFVDSNEVIQLNVNGMKQLKDLKKRVPEVFRTADAFSRRQLKVTPFVGQTMNIKFRVRLEINAAETRSFEHV